MKRLAWTGLLAVAAFSWPAGLLHAGDLYGDKDGPKLEPLVLPKPAEVQTFAVYPEKIALQNADDAQQLIVTAGLAGGRLQDLTGDVKYDVADEKVAQRHADRPRPAAGQRLDRDHGRLRRQGRSRSRSRPTTAT